MSGDLFFIGVGKQQIITSASPRDFSFDEK